MVPPGTEETGFRLRSLASAGLRPVWIKCFGRVPGSACLSKSFLAQKVGTLTPRKLFSIDDRALTGFIDAHEPLLGVFTGSLTRRILNLPISAGSLTPSEGNALVILGRMGTVTPSA